MNIDIEANLDFLKTTQCKLYRAQKIQLWNFQVIFFTCGANYHIDTLCAIYVKFYGGISCFLNEKLEIQENLQKWIKIT